MPSKADWQAALAICAAIIGAGFASGREIVSFFSCFGCASWLGILAASSGVGALVYVILRLSAQTRAQTLPSLYGTLMGQPAQDAVGILYSLLCLTTASSMLAAGTELGALAFPLRNARLLGFLLTLLLSLASVSSGFHALSLMGGILLPTMAIYFILIATEGPYTPPCSPEGLLAALPMGLLYASFNGALAGGAICLAGHTTASPARTAQLTGSLLFLILICANAAMLRAGNVIQQMALPAVALAARWGIAGYYASIVLLWLAILSTLCAMLHSLQMQFPHSRKTFSLFAYASLAAVFSVFGFQRLVNAVYPLLGWICGFALVGLMLFLPDAAASSAEIPDQSNR